MFSSVVSASAASVASASAFFFLGARFFAGAFFSSEALSVFSAVIEDVLKLAGALDVSLGAAESSGGVGEKHIFSAHPVKAALFGNSQYPSFGYSEAPIRFVAP